MDIAFGHSNMDLDCLGALIMIKKLFPSYRLVRSRLIHPAAWTLYNLYQDYFDFIDPKDLDGERVDNIIIADTCRAERVKEYFAHINIPSRGPDPAIRVFDHHGLENCDIPGAAVEGGAFGAITSCLVKMAMKRKTCLLPDEATIAMTGIYADTGRLIYENVTRADFEAAAWLLDRGAHLKLVKSFLEPIKEDRQMEVLNRLLSALETRDIQGHQVMFSYLELGEQVRGLAAVADKIMDLQNPDAYFGVFYLPRRGAILIIARSQKPAIDLHEVLSIYGGGGHQGAASAKISSRKGPDFMEELRERLEQSLAPALRAENIMTRNVYSIYETTTVLDASTFLERVNLTGVPVVNVGGLVTGFISLRDIMKGRKAGAMTAPVSAYMSKPVISAGRSVTLREIENIFFKHHISRLPILENNRLLGIVTRWDYLEHRKTPLV